jgi:hypothetical protein
MSADRLRPEVAMPIGEDVMSPAPTPTPSPTAPANPTSTIVHAVWTGLWGAITSSPLVAIFFGLAAAGAIVGFVRSIIHGGNPRDPIRRFSRTDKAEILRRAGGRCEHHGWLLGRCRATQTLEADHVHPWSRGGQTAVLNGQALCKRHNREKRATIPYGWQLRALDKRRAAYFPPAVSAAVMRRAGR